MDSQNENQVILVSEGQKSVARQILSEPVLLNQGMTLIRSAQSAWAENARMTKELEKIKEINNYRIIEMTERYALMRDTLSAIFGERFQALSAHYKVLEKGLESDNMELILGAIRGISCIVSTNPLENFQSFREALSNPNKPLELDF